MDTLYILVDGKPVIEPSLFSWLTWFIDTNNRRIDYDAIGDAHVSTVFLGIDHGFGSDRPVLFETMVFGGEHDEYQKRYCTIEEALQRHREVVNLVTGIQTPEEGFLND